MFWAIKTFKTCMAVKFIDDLNGPIGVLFYLQMVNLLAVKQNKKYCKI